MKLLKLRKTYFSAGARTFLETGQSGLAADTTRDSTGAVQEFVNQERSMQKSSVSGKIYLLFSIDTSDTSKIKSVFGGILAAE